MHRHNIHTEQCPPWARVSWYYCSSLDHTADWLLKGLSSALPAHPCTLLATARALGPPRSPHNMYPAMSMHQFLIKPSPKFPPQNTTQHISGHSHYIAANSPASLLLFLKGLAHDTVRTHEHSYVWLGQYRRTTAELIWPQHAQPSDAAVQLQVTSTGPPLG